MLAGEHPRLPRPSSFHGELFSGSSAPFSTRGKTRAGLVRHSVSTGVSSLPQAQQQQTTFHSRHQSISATSGTRLTFSPEAALAKEKEFMANTRILAMSNVIDSFTSSPHSKQGFYGKQLKIIGSSPSSPTATGAELDLVVKIHVIENTWTTCPLLPSSTILHRWKTTHLDTSNQTDGELAQDELTASDLGMRLFGRALMFQPFHLGFHGSRKVCRANFIKFQVHPSDDDMDGAVESGFKRDGDSVDITSETQEDADMDSNEGFEFNIHPKVVSLDEAHLNPESDEDAQFWLEIQEHLMGRDHFVGNFVGGDEVNGNGSYKDENSTADSNADAQANSYEIAGCFAPSSTLHISWIPRDATGFVQDVEQNMIIHIMGLPVQTKSSTLLQNRRRKDPEDSHAIDLADQDEDSIEYEHLEMDDGDLVISVEDTLKLNIQKLGWKRPFMDFTVELPDTQQSQPNEISMVDIRGDVVQDWEAITSENITPSSTSELEALEKESAADQDTYTPSVYRVWFFSGTEGMTEVHVNIRVAQAVCVGYGKDITCHIPKLRVHGTSLDNGQIHVCTSSDLVIQRSNMRLLEPLPADNHSSLEDGVATRHQPVLQYQYQSPVYELAVVVQRYQALTRIARIERVRAEIGVSNHQQPGFARIVLSNIVLPQQDDPYLRVYQLDGAEVWTVLVDGKPCSKSIQFMDRRTAGQRTILVPIPEESPDNEKLHQVEISYGFNTFDRAHEENLDNESLMSTIKLVVPGFNLPVGEYVIVASLPKLEQGVDYDEPMGDFEIMSSQGQPSQRRTITYGAYMTLGRPKLSIRTTKAERRTNRARDTHMDETEAAERFEQNMIEPLDQIGRSNVHAATVVHDPQQPPFDAGAVVVQQASQRHPQQPLELQNLHAEHTLDGEILPVLSARANGTVGGGTGSAAGQTSNLSPQVGSPASFRSAGQLSITLWDSLRSMSLTQLQYQINLWWKQVMAPAVALALVIMIINVAAFQDTQTTSLDPLHIPVWRRPFAAFGRMWHDSSNTRSPVGHSGGLDGVVQNVVGSETIVTVTVQQAHPEETQDLEIRTAPTAYRDGHVEEDDKGYHGQKDARSESEGPMSLVDLLRAFVRRLQS
ncbi:hypothetical protein BGZ65_009878 [Modicella reniformis]|uniref:Uncharacterized protein n=1 Tax=Modicella reniformis TaxID=1440133 RepID=A0A9P6SPP0_9FUNG|nr:hypothetical protein BGZ65_009878 [Modicella reniformis]